MGEVLRVSADRDCRDEGEELGVLNLRNGRGQGGVLGSVAHLLKLEGRGDEHGLCVSMACKFGTCSIFLKTEQKMFINQRGSFEQGTSQSVMERLNERRHLNLVG